MAFVTVDINPTLVGIQTDNIIVGEGSWIYNAESGIITFTPEPGFTTDPARFRYLLKENLTGLSDEGTVTIGYIEEPPTASDDNSIDNNPGNSASFNILANDKLSDGTSVIPGKVTVDIDQEMEGNQTELIVENEGVWNYNTETGTITFIPVTGFTISPSPIIYTLTENLTKLYDEGTITITYKEIPPVATDDSSTGNKPGTAASVNILNNDKLSDDTPALQGLVTIDLNPDLQGDQAELLVPEQGTWRYNRLTGRVIFTPLAGFTTDPTPITYTLTENKTGLSESALITIDYTEEPPSANNDSSYDNIPGRNVTINILENDNLSDGSLALIELVIVDLDPLVDGIQVEKEVQGEGVWTINTETGTLTFTPMQFYFSNPSPINYQLCSKLSPALCDEASVFVYYDLTLMTTSVGLVKKGVYNSNNTTVDYTFEVTNTGQLTIRNLKITDERIGITDLHVVPDSLDPGRKGTATASYIISQEDIDAEGVTNSASVSGFNLKGEPVTDISGSDVENDEPTLTVIPQNPSVFIQKEAVLFANEVVMYDNVSFNILVTNTGNVTLYNVLVEDPLTGFIQETTQLPPGESLNFTTSYIVQISDATAGQFKNEAFVNAKTFNGSLVEASSSVTLQVERCKLIIPTGFSPNDDGIQDKWRIKCLERYPDAKVEVFNRWGNKVFEKENYGNLDVHGESDAWWDGYSTQKGAFGNDKLPNGTYYYILYLNDGNKPLNGYLFLNK
ncbi:MAG: gliding motility-associated C-terminal domain-containing protein [Draconibacterium sp.]|nr:gliding motility-associated C-terminal domain-containing protein [Draconibacterium sp.]